MRLNVDKTVICRFVAAKATFPHAFFVAQVTFPHVIFVHKLAFFFVPTTFARQQQKVNVLLGFELTTF